MNNVSPINPPEPRDYSTEIAMRLSHIVAIADLVQTLAAQSPADPLGELRKGTVEAAMHCIVLTAEAASDIQLEADSAPKTGVQS